MSDAKRSYTVEPRECGPGWWVRFFEAGEPMGGGVFLPDPDDPDEAYREAVDVGERWIANTE